MNWNAAQVCGPTDSDVPDTPKPPAPSVAYCECDKPIFAVCEDCGEPSHVLVGEAVFVKDHSQCGEGWYEPDALCVRCQSAEDRAQYEDSDDFHGPFCNCGCAGH